MYPTDRSRAGLQRSGEERACSMGIPAQRDEDVDDLTVLIDRPVEIRSSRRQPLRFIRISGLPQWDERPT